MVLEFYEHPISPFCRSVQMLASVLKIKLDSKIVSLMDKEQLKPEYLAINPFHKVPSLVDDGFILYESHAIMRYLVDKYAAGNALYPKDTKERATVEQMLDVCGGTLSPSVIGMLSPLIFQGQEPKEEQQDRVRDILKSLNVVLSKHAFVAGDKLTIADISIKAILTMLEFVGLSITGYENISNWADRVKNAVPNYDAINDEPLSKLKAILEAKKQQKA